MDRGSLPAEAGIYLIRHPASGRVYVGSAKDMRARQWVHLCQLRGGRHGNRHLLRAFAKHGEASFEWSVLEAVGGGDGALIALEQHWIDAFGASCSETGFNIVDSLGATSL